MPYCSVTGKLNYSCFLAFVKCIVQEVKWKAKEKKIEILYHCVAFKQKVNGKWSMAIPFLPSRAGTSMDHFTSSIAYCSHSQLQQKTKWSIDVEWKNEKNVFPRCLFQSLSVKKKLVESMRKRERRTFQQIIFYSFDIFCIFAFIRFPILCFTLHTIK